MQTTFDPEVSEWGNPLRLIPEYPFTEYIGLGKLTRGTETSKYPEEKKENSIPPVVASEKGTVQTERRVSIACVASSGLREVFGGARFSSDRKAS